MKAIELTYGSLLADVASKSGFSEIRGSWYTLQWCIYDAPKLEKHVLTCIETGESLNLELVPRQLRRLALGAMKDPMLMRYLRQLLLFCYKANVTHDKQTTDRSFQKYLECNRTVQQFGASLSEQSPVLLNRARAYCQSVLSRVRARALRPSHGPGATTTDKSRWQKWYSAIEYLYPYSDWYALYYNQDHLAEFGSTDPTDEHIEAKLIAVPKDSRGPRLICVHPAEAIWLQQGLRRELERAITLERYRGTHPRNPARSEPKGFSRENPVAADSERSSGSIAQPTSQCNIGSRQRDPAYIGDAGLGRVDQQPIIRHMSGDGIVGASVDSNESSEGPRSENWSSGTSRKRGVSETILTPVGPWPHGHVHFDDQSVNGRIALLSSKSRKYATLDMKEASDRIAEPLVQILFGRYYKWFGCCRAQKLRIRGIYKGVDIVGDFASYAPMGNATTFPVQSLVFWAICVSSLQRQRYHQPGAVFVFGDDIIVPSECAQETIKDLESFGLVVNKEKSFWRGAFRESCGVDAFNGFNVTPIRWKTTLDAEHTEDLQSLSDLAMRLRIAGYENAAATCYDILRKRLFKRYHRELYCTNNRDHGGIAEYCLSDASVWAYAYWHKNLQVHVTPVWRLKYYDHKEVITGWNQVLESVCSLERTGRSSIPDRSATRRICLDRGWTYIK